MNRHSFPSFFPSPEDSRLLLGYSVNVSVLVEQKAKLPFHHGPSLYSSLVDHLSSEESTEFFLTFPGALRPLHPPPTPDSRRLSRSSTRKPTRWLFVEPRDVLQFELNFVRKEDADLAVSYLTPLVNSSLSLTLPSSSSFSFKIIHAEKNGFFYNFTTKNYLHAKFFFNTPSWIDTPTEGRIESLFTLPQLFTWLANTWNKLYKESSSHPSIDTKELRYWIMTSTKTTKMDISSTSLSDPEAPPIGLTGYVVLGFVPSSRSSSFSSSFSSSSPSREGLSRNDPLSSSFSSSESSESSPVVNDHQTSVSMSPTASPSSEEQYYKRLLQQLAVFASFINVSPLRKKGYGLFKARFLD